MVYPGILLLLVAALSALDVPPPADPYGLGERLAMLSYIKERGVKVRTGLDDAAVKELYSDTWQADPAHAQALGALLREQAQKDRMRDLRAGIVLQFGVQPAEGLDEEALKALRLKLEGEMRDRLADQAREAATRGELVLQRVRFTDGGTMLGLYDAVTGRIEVYDEETGRRAGEMSLNRATVASVKTVTIPVRPVAPPQAPSPEEAARQDASSAASSPVPIPSVTSGNPGSGGIWITDFAAARRSAAADHRPILMLFTGSDWCPWCIKLEEEILRTPAFSDWAKANVVLLYLDFPRQKHIDADTMLVSRGLQEKYGIRGFPTVLFVDAEGAKLGQTGYQAGGPNPWLAACNRIIGSRR